MESESGDSLGNVTLTFEIGTDMDAALLKVSNKLNQVPDYPELAEKPVIVSASEQRQAIAYIILRKTAGDPEGIVVYPDKSTLMNTDNWLNLVLPEKYFE